MKKAFLFLYSIFFLVFVVPTSALELNDVHLESGNYKVLATDGVRIYYPVAVEEAMPRIVDRFVKVRKRLIKYFPTQKNYIATIILNNHDDRVNGSTNLALNIIKLGLFEEIGALSTRGYSLEKRFAINLSNIMILRTLSASENSWKRELAVLSAPEWFIDGLTLKYAFSLDSIHYVRLLDMVRNNRFYSIEQLSTIISQPTMIREEMRFQTYSMLNYWSEKYGEDAAIKLLMTPMQGIEGFDDRFRNHYGVGLREAFNDYRQVFTRQCQQLQDNNRAQAYFIDKDSNMGGDFFRSLRHISENERVWVSSRRYITETYDLFYQKDNKKPVLLVKNVHPLLYVDKIDRKIYIGRYTVGSKLQRKLNLWAITPEGKKSCIVKNQGSFKPLGKKLGRVFYTNIRSGKTRVMSVDTDIVNSTRVEYTFPIYVPPLDLALDKSCSKLFYIAEIADSEKSIIMVSIGNSDENKESVEIYSCKGDISSIVAHDKHIWFSAEDNHFTSQLFSIRLKDYYLEKWTSLPGGVWDISFTDEKIELITMNQGQFRKTSISSKKTISSGKSLPLPVKFVIAELPEVNGSDYQSEYQSEYWSPILDSDEDGYVLGFSSYRTDRLGLSHIVAAPTYGLSSSNWGYHASIMQRFDLFKTTFSMTDSTREKSYLDNDYFERARSVILDFQYPLFLSTTISAGIDLTKRSIAKSPATPTLPTVGRDNSLYLKLKHRAIRTDPYAEVFPRLGRTVEATYKRGDKLFDGEMNYNSFWLKWREFFPLRKGWVFTARTWIAEDEKEGNIRRPDDLSLGNTDYMRAHENSYKSGDSLRYFSMHLGHPIELNFSHIVGWLYSEFTVAEIFWEAGDVKNQGRFNWNYDRGIEIRSRLLFMKRIPFVVRAGIAYQNGFNQKNSYVTFDFDSLSGIFL